MEETKTTVLRLLNPDGSLLSRNVPTFQLGSGADKYAWGKEVEARAIAMWEAHSGDLHCRLDPYARVDAFMLPKDPKGSYYLLEVKGHHRPLDSYPTTDEPLKQSIYDDLVVLSRFLRVPVVWIVVHPEGSYYITLPTQPARVNRGKVFFAIDQFQKIPDEYHQTFFGKGVF